MAKTLSKTGITTGNTVKAFHVTQSIDAFTGTDAYDITLSGSLIVTGSLVIEESSSIEALRITQTGGGDAIRVEDSTNPDATPTVITNDGDIFIGSGSAPETGGGLAPKLYAKNGSSGYTGNLAIDTAVLFESNGAAYYATLSPDANPSGMYMGSPSDIFGAFVRWGYDDAKLQLGAATVGHGIEFTVGNKSATSMQLTPNEQAVSNYNATLTVTGSIDTTQRVTTPVVRSSTGGITIAPLNGNLLVQNNLTASIISASSFIGEATNVYRPVFTASANPFTASNATAGGYYRAGGNITCSIFVTESVACTTGVEFEFFQTSSTGNVLFETGSGVTLNSKSGNLKLAGQFSGATLKYVGNNEWDLIGDLS